MEATMNMMTREELSNNELEMVIGGRTGTRSGKTVTCERCGKKYKSYLKHTCPRLPRMINPRHSRM